MKKNLYVPLFLCLLLIAPSMLTSCRNEDKKKEKEKELKELRQLAELDRREMENQYADFAAQYGEMKKTVKDDSLAAKLDAEQKHAQQLLAELKRTKAGSAAEILRLKKELATVRAVLRDYIRQVDSLQRINISLTDQRDRALQAVAKTKEENSGLTAQNESLNHTIEIASQLNASNVSVEPIKKNGKRAKKTKSIRNFAITFTITRNVTAKTGSRAVFVRLIKPNQSVVNPIGNFSYENKSIAYSAKKVIEYTGQEQQVTMYVPINEFLGAGSFSAYVFCDGQMIGSGSVFMKK